MIRRRHPSRTGCHRRACLRSQLGCLCIGSSGRDKRRVLRANERANGGWAASSELRLRGARFNSGGKPNIPSLPIKSGLTSEEPDNSRFSKTQLASTVREYYYCPVGEDRPAHGNNAIDAIQTIRGLNRLQFPEIGFKSVL